MSLFIFCDQHDVVLVASQECGQMGANFSCSSYDYTHNKNMFGQYAIN